MFILIAKAIFDSVAALYNAQPLGRFQGGPAAPVGPQVPNPGAAGSGRATAPVGPQAPARRAPRAAPGHTLACSRGWGLNFARGSVTFPAESAKTLQKKIRCAAVPSTPIAFLGERAKKKAPFKSMRSLGRRRRSSGQSAAPTPPAQTRGRSPRARGRSSLSLEFSQSPCTTPAVGGVAMQPLRTPQQPRPRRGLFSCSPPRSASRRFPPSQVSNTMQAPRSLDEVLPL